MCLTASEANATGYINASYVTVRGRCAGAFFKRFLLRLTSPVFPQGLRHCKEFIVSQTPLSSTVADFWRLIWEHNAHTLVRLPGPHSQVQIQVQVEEGLMPAGLC